MGAQEAQQVTQSAEPRARDLGQQNDPSLTDLFSSRSTRKGILYLLLVVGLITMGVALSYFLFPLRRFGSSTEYSRNIVDGKFRCR